MVASTPMRAQPLPTTREGFQASRILKRRMILADYVEPIVAELWENEQFHNYVDPTNDDEAVEGSIEIDYVKAAEMIRDFAIEHNIKDVKKHNLKALVLALRRVLWRHHASVAQRERDPDMSTNDPAKEPKSKEPKEPKNSEE